LSGHPRIAKLAETGLVPLFPWLLFHSQLFLQETGALVRFEVEGEKRRNNKMLWMPSCLLRAFQQYNQFRSDCCGFGVVCTKGDNQTRKRGSWWVVERRLIWALFCVADWDWDGVVLCVGRFFLVEWMSSFVRW
jgi:hypothetical protein